MSLSIEQIQETVNEVVADFNASAPEDKVKSIALFGSRASNTANENSDVDLLVEFNSAFVSLFVLGKLLTELEEALQTTVDLVTLPLPEESFISIEKVIPLYEG